jgi:hypothetical protein
VGDVPKSTHDAPEIPTLDQNINHTQDNQMYTTFAVSKMASYVFVSSKTGPIYGMETNMKSGNGWF